MKTALVHQTVFSCNNRLSCNKALQAVGEMRDRKSVV